MKSLTYSRLSLDWKVAWVTIASTLLLLVDHYYRLTASKYWDRFLLYLVIPLLLVVFVFRESPATYGFRLGNWKRGLLYTSLSILGMAPIIYALGHANPAMRAYYAPLVGGLPWTTFLDLVGWEFFFRGLILFAYLRCFGQDALWLQAVPFALAHMGKPALESFSTIFGGFAFGWIAFQTESFLYPFLIHWFISTFIIFVAGRLA